MFYPLTGSQIFGFSPNNHRCYASTTLLQHKKTLFAFASDNNVVIFDRLTLKSQIIAIPDISTQIISITFTGNGDYTSIFVALENGKLYSYLLSDLKNPVMETNFDFIPTSITASNEYLFCKTSAILYAIPITYNSINLKEKIILSETLVHDKYLISPCGRCLASYTKGAKCPVFWYAPFERRRRSNLPIDGHISDFQWGSSDRLLCVTATVEGIVRIWEESTTSYELRCVKWFDYGRKVISAAIITSADVENQIELKSCQKAASDSGRVFPAVKRPKKLIMASVEDEKSTICLLQEKKRPQLYPLGRLVISYEYPIATFCDMKRIFSEGELKMLISMIRFSSSSLDFDQFELGSSKMSHTTPLRIPFIKSPIISIEKQSKILTHHQDGTLYDWWKLEKIDDKCEYLEKSEFKEGNITVTTSEITFEISNPKTDDKNNVNRNIQKYTFKNPVNFATIMKYEKNAIISATNLNEVYIIILTVKEDSKNTFTYKFERIPVNNESQNILSITVHSTDLFVLSTSKSVDAYFFIDNKYVKIASLDSENSCSLFIPHPMALIAISTSANLKFYIVWSNRFIPIEEFDENLNNNYLYPLFTAMNITEEGSIIAATKHCLYDLEFYATNFPIPYPLGNNLILNTSFTLCYFYLLYEILNGHKITINSYKVKMQSEMFSFPKEPPKRIAKSIIDICNKPPPSWGNLDENGLRFLFSYKFLNGSDMKDLTYLVPFFSIWALLSVDQSCLITSLNPKNAKMIFDMKIEVWVKDISVLTKALTYLVEETVPTNEEFDTYLFFCVLLNRKASAKRIARIKHQNKLENFFSTDETEKNEKLLKKIEKSAFEAQKLHRNSLAAMFFTLKGMKKQALIVLKDELPLLLIALRLFNEPDWFESIPTDYVNGFFTKWWRYYTKQKEFLDKYNGRIDSIRANELETFKKSAVDSLKNWKFQKSEKISIEMHKFEMLKKFNASEPSDLLSIQLTPGFIEMQALESNSELINAMNLNPEKSANNSEPDDNKKEKNDEDEEKTKEDEKSDSIQLDSNDKENSLASFDFGGGLNDDWGIDDADFSFDDDEEEEDNKNNEKNASEVENQLFEKDNKIVRKYFDSNFHKICQMYPFNSPGPICYTFNESFIVFLISSLFNETYNDGTIKLITHVSDVLYQKAKEINKKENQEEDDENQQQQNSKHPIIPLPKSHPLPRRSPKKNEMNPNMKKKISTIIAILYALTYVFSKANMMMTLFTNPIPLDSLGTLVADFVNHKTKHKNRNQPNILKRFVEKNVDVDENDRLLANFISFNEICKVLIRQGLLSQIQMLISFFHHRNRLMFSDLNSFTFTQKTYILDLETIGLQCGDIFEQIRLNMMNRKWQVTMVNQFISPFYFGDRFQCTKSYEKQSTRYKTEELSSSSSSSEESFESEFSNSKSNSNSNSHFNEPSYAFDTSSIKSKSAFNIEDAADRKRLITTSSSSSNLYSSSISNKIAPPSILAVCVNSRNLNDVAIGGKKGVEFIDISKQDTLNSSASNPNISFNSQPSLIDIVDSFVDTDDQLFKSLSHDSSGMTKSISTNFHNKNKNDSTSTTSTANKKARNSHLALFQSSTDSTDNNSSNIGLIEKGNSMLRSASVETQKKSEVPSSLANQNSFIQPFDSPFVSLMGQAKVNSFNKKFNEKKGFFYQKREFDPAWSKDKVHLKDLDVTCMASHPREAYFIIGTVNGRLYMASFGKKSTISSVLYRESPVSSLELNDTGDRLLTALENGYIYVSDFKTANLYVSVSGATVAWLNNDTQFIVCEPMNKQFVIYDIIAGLSPVAIYQIPQAIRINTFPKDYYSFLAASYAQKHRSRTFSHKKTKRKELYSQPRKIPIAVCGQQVITGHEDGTVVKFDLRSQDFTSFKLHKSPVTTIKIDRSERFFISGSSDNSLKIVNTMVDSTPQTLREVFSSYDQIPNDEPKGVTDIAITDQTIVAVGHSSTIHAWTVNEPRGLL